MKAPTKTLTVLVLLTLAVVCHGFGVVVINAQQLQLLPPSQSEYQVHVENQAAVTRVHSEFINPRDNAFEPVWAFPLPADASATRLRYRLNGVWNEVGIAIGPQDPGLPGGNQHPLLRAYLGATPLVFHFSHDLVPDSTLIVELDYVELLPYSNGTVTMRHPGTLASILPNQIFEVGYHLFLESDRTITSLALTSGHTGESVVVEGGTGEIIWHDPAIYPDEDFTVSYGLDQDELGLFATSTMLPDTLMPEDGATGFVMLVAEPDPDDQQAIMDKVFTLIIDRSGSMAGQKIIQARAAATFIVEHLNEGDMFNLITFNNTVQAFRTEHVEFTPPNRAAALAWINTLTATSTTNISGAFDMAVPQFASAGDGTANIILFFTDGNATSGITVPAQLLAHVDNLFDAQEAPISLFNFGIGSDVNRPVLAQMAAHNLGFAEFLDNDELQSRISDFYLRVRNPVLMQPVITADPPVIQNLVPLQVPNIYVGEQLIAAGRYSQATPVTLTLSGNAFGQLIEYSYPLELASGYEESRAYLPKVWAKRMIESLMVLYYQYDEDSEEAQELEEQITELSLTWGVISIFTSFSDDVSVPEPDTGTVPASLLLVANHPNPFNPSTTLRITVPEGMARGPLLIRIYNIQGQLVRTLGLIAEQAGVYELVWDGLNESGSPLASGTYVVMVSLGDHLTAHRMLLLK